jgi:hypothetical protein
VAPKWQLNLTPKWRLYWGGDKKLGNYSAKSGSGNSLTGMKRMKGIKLKKGICTYLILSQQNA